MNNLFKTVTGVSNDFIGRYLGFSIYVSNTPNKSDGVLCYKDSNLTVVTFPEVLDTPCDSSGQYVIYHNERLTNVTYPEDYDPQVTNRLCEVEVYGKYCMCMTVYM